MSDGDSEDDCTEALVIDNGTWMCKAGWAGDKTARAYVPTVIGEDSGSQCFGDAVYDMSDPAAIRCPMERGIVTNWTDMEDFWHYVLEKELSRGACSLLSPTILMTEVPLNPKGNREKMVQILVEKFDVSALCFYDPATLALFSSGRSSGITLDVGHSVTHTSAIIDGYAIMESVRRVDLGGDDVNVHLSKKLQKCGYSFSTPIEMRMLEFVKHKLGYEDVSGINNLCRYELPDGTVIEADDIADSHKILVDPELLGLDVPGIDKVLFDSISSCDVDTRKSLYSNIILAGGTTMHKGLPDYIEKRIEQLRDRASPVMKIIAPPERKKSTWLGGSIVASLSDFRKNCKTKEDYYENGPTIFHTV